ncbi:hypothetical protein BG003_000172 [Podila horticola]|nr:hypothetical protein BG003_000172 [Podila horticola]
MDKLFLSKANVLSVQEVSTNVRLEVHTQPKDAKKGLSRTCQAWFSNLDEQHEIARSKALEFFMHH